MAGRRPLPNEEYACAAYLSGDENMIRGYGLKDVYQNVADQLGVTRKNAKTAMLATQYGAGPRRLRTAYESRTPKRSVFSAITKKPIPRIGSGRIHASTPLHDAVLIQAPARKAEKYAEKMCGIMREASRQFLSGNEVRVAAHVYSDRFEDKDGKEDWKRISKLLKKYK